MVDLTYKIIFKSFLLLIGTVFLANLYVNVNASTIGWMPSAGYSVEIKDSLNTPYKSDAIGQRQCSLQRIAVQGEIDLRDVCFTHGAKLSYGFYKNAYSGWSGVVKYKYDSKAYPVEGIGHAEYTIVVPGTDTLVSFHPRSQGGRNFTLTVQKNISWSLEGVSNNTGAVNSYRLDSSKHLFTSKIEGYSWPVTAVNHSSNGKWLIANVTNIGMLRFNMETGAIDRFSHISLSYSGSRPALDLSLAISNDGKYAALGGNGSDVPFKVYTLTNDCLEVFDNSLSTDPAPWMNNPCVEVELRQRVDATILGGYSYERNISFSNDGGILRFFAHRAESQDGKWVDVSAANYAKVKLDYLAMGDSYSSGEGDTEVIGGKKFYLPGTDVEVDEWRPREKCHISSRSYPFILRDAMGISDMSTKSVACSGAEIGRDYITNNDYRGQNDSGSPRLEKLLPDELKSSQNIARTNFVPGRIQQVEFIEQTQPQAITITGAGNDIGFGGVIKNCLFGLAACSEAQTTEGRARIGQEIVRQHEQLFRLYREIKTTSPSTKIYAIGYPQFLNGESHFCAPNVHLDSSERKFIVESVKFLNDIIEDAATNAGAQYIDIENSLQGHRLCESGKSFVTGVALAGKSEQQESFHPNHNGHKLMADTILSSLGGESLLKYAINTDQIDLTNQLSVEVPVYFKADINQTGNKYVRDQLTGSGYIQKGDIFNVTLENMKPGSRVDIEIHSTPISVGVYFTDTHGRLSINAAVPIDIPAGYHTIHALGQTHSGEAIDIWQTIEIRGNAGDIDEDSIADENDLCVYVKEAAVDNDADGIDDGCDVIIEDLDAGQSRVVAAVNVADVIQRGVQGVDREGSYDSSRNSIGMQSQTGQLLSPAIFANNRHTSDDVINVGVFYILGAGAIMLILILIWMIKRYST